MRLPADHCPELTSGQCNSLLDTQAQYVTLQCGCLQIIALNLPLDNGILLAHTCFMALQYGCLQIIALNLPVDEVNGMREMFQEIDKDRSGSITVEEFVEALHKKGQAVSEQEIKRIISVRVCVCVCVHV
jgi:hypothetical protein